MSHLIELEELMEEQSSPLLEETDHTELLDLRRDARAYGSHSHCNAMWYNLRYRMRQLFALPPGAPKRIAQILYAITLVSFGIFIAFISNAIVRWKTADPFDLFFATFWDNTPHSAYKPAKYPIEFFGNVLPIPCHSHNDYWRRTPLFAALGSGCISVEADVFYRNGDLYVGHTENALHGSRTLESMYINRLVDLLDAMNPTKWKAKDPKGVFYNEPKQSLTLIVDFKTEGIDTWKALHKQLQPLRERDWLTYWNGTHRVDRPLTIVASGAASRDIAVSNGPKRDIFLDAPLDELDRKSDDGEQLMYNESNSYLASVNFYKAVGSVFRGKINDEQLQVLRHQIRSAKERGLVPRYWGTPRWPRGLRDEVWGILVREEVGLLNVDDLRAVRKGGWGFRS
ncbi:Altered inheritance of mitochondria protein 6 [Kalmusia sp. IMI 367209]|nr:Altered inheritance of mitochondria protein 6 [Kalmusia sp. IMI 367209]